MAGTEIAVRALAPTVALPKPRRLFAPDALRGLIIVFMALDHANLLVAQKHPPSEMWGGAFPVYYNALAFLTRLLTHLAAPGFFLLMGAGMVLFARSRVARGWGKWQVVQHFVIRGALLIAIQLLVVNRLWELSPGGWGIPNYIGVLVALGINMILGSVLLWLKPIHLASLALVAAVGIELLMPNPAMWAPETNLARVLFLVPGGLVRSDGSLVLWVNYPALPWLKLVALGMVFGHWFAEQPDKAFSRAWKTGLAFLAAFALIRYLDGFGNIRPRMGNSWMDFLNMVKYPPSLAFALFTTGVNLVMLWAFSKVGRWAQPLLSPLAVFGRTPFLFYVAHIVTYLLLAYGLTPYGTDMVTMYIYWALGLVILFPLCLVYGRLKQRQPSESLLRFL